MVSNRIVTRRYFLPGITWTGVLISLLLVSHRRQGLFCGGADVAGTLSSCDAVISSSYGRIGGIPLSVIGVAAYSAIFIGFTVCLFLPPSTWRDRLGLALRICVLFGALASAILVGVQAFKIHAFCPLCCGSAACFFTLALLTCLPVRDSNPESSPTHSANVSSIAALAFPLPFLVTTAVLITILFTDKPVLPGTATILATVDGQPIRESDLPTALRLNIQPLEEDAEKMRQEWLDQHLDEIVLEREAKRRGISAKDLLARQTSAIAISDADIAGWRKDHSDEGMMSNEDVSARIRLSKKSAAEDAYLAQLRKTHNATILIHPPTPPTVHFDLTHAELDGPANAPAVFVVFSDLECPFCRQLGANLRAVRRQLGDHVAIAFKNLPLEAIHPKAHAFALAAIAAGEQNKFWQFHDALISQDLASDDATLIEQARILGLDVPRFTGALHSKQVADHLGADVKEAESQGLQQTPTLFLNGHMAGGLHSTEELIQMAR